MRRFIAATAILSLLGASTSAIAASNTAISSPASSASGSWGMLSAMTGSSAMTAAIRDDDDRDGFGHAPFLALAVILATLGVAIWLLIDDDDDDDGRIELNPQSPN